MHTTNKCYVNNENKVQAAKLKYKQFGDSWLLYFLSWSFSNTDTMTFFFVSLFVCIYILFEYVQQY